MATSYTGNVKLGMPAVADRNWNLVLNANAGTLDTLAPVGGLCVTPAEVPSASLSVRVAAGTYRKKDGTAGTFAGAASFALPAAKVTSLYLSDAGSLLTATGGYPATACVRLATVTTGPTTVLSVADDRLVCGVVGTDVSAFLPLAGGTLADGAGVAVGTSSGAQIGTASGQKLGFWGATPIVRPGPYTQTYSTASRALAAYSPTVETTSFSGVASGQSGSPYAQVSDLNNLRSAYENLRALAENVAQVLNALINDLRSTGLLS
ncbi:hypothetical protein OJF2_72450 [Aquisphaera giovannonii]|uniref:Uncharacterized protein n=1 Tax=Aquisphaera giovannonii TaxID=406548 RepID=A0A5B9WEH5_9BACT|nr:hypothetical protein [Aquisphaera giovannonii]QEH38639.1 hypothetical protein OJF2_72450 [Aquisphaera giovannonii]